MGKYIKFLVSLLIGALFLWLAFRSVDISEVLTSMGKMTYGWIPFYVLATILAHYSRAERWRLLFDRSDHETLPRRSTLFNGVMIGYLVNYAIPRLGEVSRSVYITKKEGGSNSKALGAIFLERFVDLFVLLFMLAFISIYVITDATALRSIFGNETIELFQLAQKPINILYMVLIGIGLVGLAFLTHFSLKKTGNRIDFVKTAYDKLFEIGKLFADGLFSLRRVPNWPLFIVTTFSIWFCYILLAYIPFFGFGMVAEFNLGLREAFVIMVVSAIGVALPSPGGVGTYHWFVGQTLIVIYLLPPALAMAYAFVTHAIMFLVIITITPIGLILFEKASPLLTIKKIFKNVS